MRMMRLSKRLAFFEAWTICSEVRAYPKNAKDRLQPLVESLLGGLPLQSKAHWRTGTVARQLSTQLARHRSLRVLLRQESREA